jgi:hypothetical protein
MFHDKYERINFWSHAVPGLLFLAAAWLCRRGALPGGPALAVFAACTASTHLISALTHVYPDSHFVVRKACDLPARCRRACPAAAPPPPEPRPPSVRAQEKCDHLGITATILGTPVTALMALQHGHLPASLAYVCAALVAAAFLPALPRVLGFMACGGAMGESSDARLRFCAALGARCAGMLPAHPALSLIGPWRRGAAAVLRAAVVMYGAQVIDPVFAVEIVLYLSGGAFFLRNGGHSR